jgi:predicted nucleotidyltransferase
MKELSSPSLVIIGIYFLNYWKSLIVKIYLLIRDIALLNKITGSVAEPYNYVGGIMRKSITIIFLIIINQLFSFNQIKEDYFNYKGVIYQKGKINVKLKENLTEKSFYNIPSLKNRITRFSIDYISKKFNPKDKAHSINRIYELEFDKEINPLAIANSFNDDVNIEYAEMIPIDSTLESPNDPQFANMDYLQQISAESAWDIHKGENGTDQILVAICDNGVEWFHQDLVDNLYQNLAEDSDNDGHTIEFINGAWQLDTGDLDNLDNDNNGYVDDLIGWNFYGNNNNPATGYHGTKVCGMAAAVTNNSIGVSSIGWNIKFLPIKTGDGGSINSGYQGIIFAADNGADIVNCSWGGTGSSQTNQDVIDYATNLGTIVVAACGNSNSESILYPAGYRHVISVANVNLDDTKYSSSSYGLSVDIASPGANILSTSTGGSYSSSGSGTSYASPIVAGSIALLKSFHPDWSSEQLITQTLLAADNINQINPNYSNMLGEGRVNVFNMLDATYTNNNNSGLELALVQVLPPSDNNNNSAIEAGETFMLNLKIRNYSHLQEDNINLILSSNDSDINIIDNSVSGFIGKDALLTLENCFEIKVSENCQSHFIPFELSISSTSEILFGENLSFEVLVNSGGIFVWEGTQNGDDLSGTFIKNYLESENLSVVYGNEFPSSFIGFDAVFLSFGAIGTNCVRLSKTAMLDAIKNYIYDGGKIYIEGSDTIGFDLGYYLNDTTLFPLLGIATAVDGTTNVISNLVGQNNSICENINFVSSSQSNNDWIDIFTSNQNGQTAFIEDNYGEVAIQNHGSYGQKTFCFSYVLSELNDTGFPNTRENLLANILDFFDRPSQLSTPNNIVIEIINNQVNISWDTVSWANEYKIYSSQNPESDFILDESGTFFGTKWIAPVTENMMFYKVTAE